ncbi:hypothetical protein ColKHC_13570 [Colletotrichum higginsianum]|nr:hypothetical protein ColKHC_13570 [Colletotrichum higginsianum]
MVQTHPQEIHVPRNSLSYHITIRVQQAVHDDLEAPAKRNLARAMPIRRYAATPLRRAARPYSVPIPPVGDPLLRYPVPRGLEAVRVRSDDDRQGFRP